MLNDFEIKNKLKLSRKSIRLLEQQLNVFLKSYIKK